MSHTYTPHIVYFTAYRGVERGRGDIDAGMASALLEKKLEKSIPH